MTVILSNVIWEILMNTFRLIVNNPFEENFYEKGKKKVIYVLIAFFISYKSSVKIFLK